VDSITLRDFSLEEIRADVNSLLYPRGNGTVNGNRNTSNNIAHLPNDWPHRSVKLLWSDIVSVDQKLPKDILSKLMDMKFSRMMWRLSWLDGHPSDILQGVHVQNLKYQIIARSALLKSKMCLRHKLTVFFTPKVAWTRGAQYGGRSSQQHLWNKENVFRKQIIIKQLLTWMQFYDCMYECINININCK